MQKKITILIAFLSSVFLAGCSASPSVSGDRPILPPEIERYSAIYTSTAQAEATGIARATAAVAEVQFIATSTAIAHQMQGTEIALMEVAANATHQVEIRQAELSQAQAQATAAQLSVTATAQFYAQQSVLDDQERQDARERWWVIWWSAVIAWVIFLLTLVSWVFSRAVSNVAPLLARSLWLAMRPPEMTTIIDQKPEELPPPKSRIEKWQDYVIAFCQFGEMAKCAELENTEPFSERRFDLVGIERPMWETTLTWLMEAQVLTRINHAKNSRAFWAGDWNLAELRRKIMMLDLPYPTDRDPPSVDFSVLFRARAQLSAVAHTV